MESLVRIQKELKAPKSQYNSFGKYNYRNAEDILEAVKPLLEDAILTINDDVVEIGGRVYVKATATLTDKTMSVSASAFAREPLTQKGMNDAMCTGSASSYARKYAMNGLFCIDDSKDVDHDNTETKPDLVAHNECVRDNMQSVNAVKEGIALEDLSMAHEAWTELDREIQILLWKAPSKGGMFTTNERTVMKSTEFRTANGSAEEEESI